MKWSVCLMTLQVPVLEQALLLVHGRSKRGPAAIQGESTGGPTGPSATESEPKRESLFQEETAPKEKTG